MRQQGKLKCEKRCWDETKKEEKKRKIKIKRKSENVWKDTICYYYYYYYYYYYLLLFEFLTPALADGFSQEFE